MPRQREEERCSTEGNKWGLQRKRETEALTRWMKSKRLGDETMSQRMTDRSTWQIDRRRDKEGFSSGRIMKKG